MEKSGTKRARAILDRHAVQARSPLLCKAIGESVGYLLQGHTDGRMIVAIPDFVHGTLTIAEDTPKINNTGQTFFNRDEEYREICMSADAFRILIDIMMEACGMELVPERNKGGRPSIYSMEDAKRIAGLRKDGMSLRAIAQKEKMSTATVQKLLKKYESIEMMEKLGNP